MGKGMVATAIRGDTDTGRTPSTASQDYLKNSFLTAGFPMVLHGYRHLIGAFGVAIGRPWAKRTRQRRRRWQLGLGDGKLRVDRGPGQQGRGIGGAVGRRRRRQWRSRLQQRGQPLFSAGLAIGGNGGAGVLFPIPEPGSRAPIPRPMSTTAGVRQFAELPAVPGDNEHAGRRRLRPNPQPPPCYAPAWPRWARSAGGGRHPDPDPDLLRSSSPREEGAIKPSPSGRGLGEGALSRASR